MFVSNYFKLAINFKLPASKHISLPLCKLYVSLHFLSTQCINFASTNLFNIDFKKLSRVYEAILLMHLRTKKVSDTFREDPDASGIFDEQRFADLRVGKHRKNRFYSRHET